jgi:hypothetical protein
MDRSQSPLRPELQLTPELFDQYVAKARAERAKAIAEFWAWIADRVGRLLRPRAAPTPRKLAR